jgi:hypothetical protein
VLLLTLLQHISTIKGDGYVDEGCFAREKEVG